MSDDQSSSSELSSIDGHVFSFIFAAATAVFTFWLAFSEAKSWHPPSALLVSLIMGQPWWAGSWAAAGPIHRLWRALLLIAAIIVTTAAQILMMTPSERIDGAAAGLAVSCVFAAPAFVGALALRFALLKRSRRDVGPFRFPMKELLAWTSLCAVVAWGLARADFDHVLELYDVTLYIVAAGILTGLAAAIYLCPAAMKLRYRVVATVALFTCLWVTKVNFGDSVDPNISEGTIGGFFYVLLAVSVAGVDRRLVSM